MINNLINNSFNTIYILSTNRKALQCLCKYMHSTKPIKCSTINCQKPKKRCEDKETDTFIKVKEVFISREREFFK